MTTSATIGVVYRRLAIHYRHLTRTQQRAAVATIGALLAALIYFALLQPALQFSARAQMQLEQEKQLLAFITQHADQIRQVNAARQAKTGQDTSLLALAANTATEHALTIQRSEPSSDGKLSVWLSQIEFNQLLIWLDQLTNQYNIQIERVNISQTERPAIVEVQIVIK